MRRRGGRGRAEWLLGMFRWPVSTGVMNRLCRDESVNVHPFENDPHNVDPGGWGSPPRRGKFRYPCGGFV